jgi:hypothetical protein
MYALSCQKTKSYQNRMRKVQSNSHRYWMIARGPYEAAIGICFYQLRQPFYCAEKAAVCCASVNVAVQRHICSLASVDHEPYATQSRKNAWKCRYALRGAF